jgi:oligoendopeptidase F
MDKTYAQTAWSLYDLFPAGKGPEIDAAFSQVEEKAAAFESLRPHLSPDMAPGAFVDMVGQLEDISRVARIIGSYAALWFSENTQDQAAQSLMARVDQFTAQIQNRTLFFELWWKALDEARAGRFLDEAGEYRYWLEEMRLFKPHTLSEPEEKVINIKDVTGSRALETLYDTITNRYVFRVEVADGQVKELTRGELMVYARHHDPELRARAYSELYRVYGDDNLILGQIYQNLVRDWRNEKIDLRRFATPISARNLANAVPDDVVDTLLEVSRGNAAVFQRFFRLKARSLGVERLRRYDIYAPVARADKQYPFAEAAEMVLSSFKGLDQKVAGLAQRVFDEGHLDSEVRKGKRSGAFCASVLPGMTPWVLLNYQGRADDVATMAHELGHAVHSLLASHRSLFTFHASLPLAETSSTFAEMVLVDKLLQQESDERVRRDILFRQVDDAYATIMRQAYFALFERNSHEMVREGASVAELADAYMSNLRDQFGESVDVSDEFRWEWLSIPHIYQVPFYVYAYAFGQLLVLSLYQQFRAEGDAFKPRYLNILAAGSSDSPERILAKAGIDIRSAEFWQGGFDVVRGLVDKLEAAAGSAG